MISENRLSSKTDIASMPLDGLIEWAKEKGEKSFRAKQIYRWLHVNMASSADEMTNLPASLREKIKNECVPFMVSQAVVQQSKLDGTRKYLFELADGCMVESVLMRYKHGNSVCISSQAGCAMGCAFCASAIGGLVRGLTPYEMLGQIYRISSDISERISNVVVMGTGEPLDNYENLLIFIRMLSDKNGQNISQRNITVSTCGIVPKIRALSKEGLSVTLALSLHACSQEEREKLMPIARRYNIEETIEACRYYFKKTGRRVTFEYSLIKGKNDSADDASKLFGLLGKNTGWYHINLIPVNPVTEKGYERPDETTISAFKNKLEKYGINVTIRRAMGTDIDSACGQLRSRFLKKADTVK